MKYFYSVILAILFMGYMFGQNAVTPGALRLNATFQHIAIQIDISGDANLNSQFSIAYRIAGSGNAFSPAAETMRAHPSQIVDGSALNRNFHAGSIFFLLPDMTYDVRLHLTDPDGGILLDTVSLTTRAIPASDENGAQKYVVPGNGGGAGTMSDPYLGLQFAANQAQPGDIYNVSPGNYASFDINTDGQAGQPIVFRGTAIHEAVIDGGNTARGIITLGVFNDSLQHIILDGFLIKNGRWGIDAQNTQYLTVRNNKIEDVDYGIVNRRANGWEHDQYIVNNSWVGRTTWPQTGGQIPSERCIDLRGNNNVVSFNFISNFGDGISTDGPPYSVSYCTDIHNNDIQNIVDDAIEVDGSNSNAAVYSNRCFNARMGVSIAPILGGPCYIFRNIFYNLETSAFKMNRSPAGLIVCHNTSMKTGNGTSSDAGWQNTRFRNNIIMGDRYCMEEYGLVAGSTDDWDFNAYYSTRIGTSGEPWFKWDNVRYSNISDFSTNSGIESNGIATSPSDLELVSMPLQFTTTYDPMNFNFSPAANVALINTGDQISHLNEIFVNDGLPDIGAIESGMPLPIYGPDFTQFSSVEFNTTVNDICIFPNPATHFITLKGDLNNYSIKILDVNGQLYQPVNNAGSYHVIDISSLGEGLYFIELENLLSQEIYVRKIVKYN